MSENIFLNGEYLESKNVSFARLANTLLKDEESARDNHVLACNFAKYSPILFFLNNQLRFDRMMVMSLLPCFFGPPCIWRKIL